MYEKIPRKAISGKHILAIDYGQKFTGLANFNVDSDPFVLTYGRIKFESDEQLVKELLHVIEEEFIDILVLGIPLFTDGTESTMTKTVKAFAEKLKVSTTCELYFQDETLSSYEAEERMKNDPRYNFKVDLTKIDAVAASIILEDFLKRSSD
jgi:putative Holliday junction resolvase